MSQSLSLFRNNLIGGGIILKVVLADDEYFFRKALLHNIEWEKNGFEVVGDANNGGSAFELICREHPDIAIVDINMPECDGLELIEKLIQAGEKCKYVILSGYDEFRYAQKAIHLGVSEYVLKPVDYDEFLNLLKRMRKAIETGRETGITAAFFTGESIPSDGGEPVREQADEALPESKISDNQCVAARVQGYIEQNYTDSTLSVAAIAKNLYLNYSYICYCFKRDKGVTINDFINKLRIEKAIDMFRQGHENISYVAQKAGYENPGYFSRRFRQATGFSPSEYIRDHN